MRKLKAHVEKTRSRVELEKHNWLDFIKVADLEGECPRRDAFEQILGKNNPAVKTEAMMYNHCIHSIFAAAKRQMKAAPKPDPKIADDFVEFSKSILNGTCPPHLASPQLYEELKHFKYSFNQWYQHNNLTKQKDIDKYLDYLHNGSSNLTKRQIEEMESTIYTGICKQEIQPIDGKSRMVCSIPIKTKVTMGPITWKLEEIMAKHFPGYCGNKNLQEMSESVNKILEQGFTKIVEGDGSAFDNTQDITLKEVDRYLYSLVEDKVYHVPRSQFREISQQYYKTMDVQYIQNKKKKRLFRYRILGSVFSGDCDTTLCNTMRMALYNLYINERSGLQYGKDYVLFSKGDDFSIFYKPYITDDFIKTIYYTYFINPDVQKDPHIQFGLGQVLKFIEIGDASTLSFCSLRAFYTSPREDKIILVRDFRKFLNISKYARKIKTLVGKHRAAYLLQQAVALRATYKGIKIFENMADAFEQEARQYTYYINRFNKTKAEAMMNAAYTLTQAIVQQSRKAMAKYIDENPILYDVAVKQTENIKIRNKMSYWETVKYYQQKCSYNLTKQELLYINQQIENEIETEEFKATMGLKNRLYELKQQ